MSELEDTYWWHVGRMKIVDKELGRRLVSLPRGRKILNVGSGTGGTVPMLEKFGDVSNVDTSPEAIKFAKSKGVKNITRVDGIDLPFKDGSFDVVVALDVLEHIENHRLATAEWNRVLKDGGILLLTVPAYQWLWSNHDVSLHHFRRYTRRNLVKILESTGFNMVKQTYVIVFSFFLIASYRMISKLTRKEPKTSYVFLPDKINSFFIRLLEAEAVALKYLNFPFGTSVLVVAKKAID